MFQVGNLCYLGGSITKLTCSNSPKLVQSATTLNETKVG